MCASARTHTHTHKHTHTHTEYILIFTQKENIHIDERSLRKLNSKGTFTDTKYELTKITTTYQNNLYHKRKR